MTDNMSTVGFIAIFVLLVVWAARASATLSRRKRSPLAEIIGPALLKHGLNLLSSRIPPEGDTGPFPHPGGTASHVGAYLAVGTPWQFRVVCFTTPDGREHEVWARLFFDGKRVSRIDWQPELDSINREAEHHPGGYSEKPQAAPRKPSG